MMLFFSSKSSPVVYSLILLHILFLFSSIICSSLLVSAQNSSSSSSCPVPRASLIEAVASGSAAPIPAQCSPSSSFCNDCPCGLGRLLLDAGLNITSLEEEEEEMLSALTDCALANIDIVMEVGVPLVNLFQLATCNLTQVPECLLEGEEEVVVEGGEHRLGFNGSLVLDDGSHCLCGAMLEELQSNRSVTVEEGEDETSDYLCPFGYVGFPKCSLCTSDSSCTSDFENVAAARTHCTHALLFTPTTREKHISCIPLSFVALMQGNVTLDCDVEAESCWLGIPFDDPTSHFHKMLECQGEKCIFESGTSNLVCQNAGCDCGDPLAPDLGCAGAPFPVALLKATSTAPGATTSLSCSSDKICDLVIDGIDLKFQGECEAGSCETAEEAERLHQMIMFNATFESDEAWEEKQVALLIGILIGCVLLGTTFLFLLADFLIARYIKHYGPLQRRYEEEEEDKQKHDFRWSDLTVTLPVARTALPPFLWLGKRIHPSSSASSSSSASACRTILSNVSGHVTSSLTILGPSGSGKSTLLHALARTLPREMKMASGEIRLNNESVDSCTDYQRSIGFVQQSDILSPHLTVVETLLYCASLRCPWYWSQAEMRKNTEETLNALSLTAVRDAQIGDGSVASSHRGLSGGERRRVSIGCALVGKPKLMFCDEPTSGLDACAATSVVKLLLEMQRERNMLLLMTLHQPSADMFLRLPSVMILAKGDVIWYGAGNRAESFLANAGFPLPPPENSNAQNIADHFLSVVSLDDKVCAVLKECYRAYKDNVDDFHTHPMHDEPKEDSAGRDITTAAAVDAYDLEEDLSLAPQRRNSRGQTYIELVKSSSSAAAAYADEDVSRKSCSQETEGAHHSSSRRYWPILVHRELKILLRKEFSILYRSPTLLCAHIFIALGLSSLLGAFYFHVSDDIKGFQNRSGSIFFTLIFFALASTTAVELMLGERQVYLKEVQGEYHSIFAYWAAKSTVDGIMLRLIPAFVYTPIFYLLMGLRLDGGRFWIFLFTLILFNMAAGALGLLFASIFHKSVGTASLAITCWTLVNMLWGGYLLNMSQGLKHILRYFSIVYYGFETMLSNELDGTTLTYTNKYGGEVSFLGSFFVKELGLSPGTFTITKNLLLLLLVYVVYLLLFNFVLNVTSPLPRLVRRDRRWWRRRKTVMLLPSEV